MVNFNLVRRNCDFASNQPGREVAFGEVLSVAELLGFLEELETEIRERLDNLDPDGGWL